MDLHRDERAYYSDSIAQFLIRPPDEILGQLVRGARADGWNVQTSQTDAWLGQIALLKPLLARYQNDGAVYFEYVIPQLRRIGVVHQVARQTGLIEAIDDNVRVLKVHLPYHESDHVLNIAYNVLAGGRCLDHLELLRCDEGYLNALGARRIPDPTTAGDFCRRFENEQPILMLMEAINEVRLKVWKQQEPEFFSQAILDADGTIAPTTGQCKQGMNISYDGQWGYHPLVVSLANTKEPLYLLNRPGNRPSHEGADEYLDKAVTLCRRAGFQRILLRGDTDFMQTWKLEFITFVNGLIRLPCQIIKTGRRIIFRLMSWNPWMSPLLRLSERMHQPLRC